MNEQIKQLAIKAGYTKDMFGVGHWDMPENPTVFEFSKFVEAKLKELNT